MKFRPASVFVMLLVCLEGHSLFSEEKLGFDQEVRPSVTKEEAQEVTGVDIESSIERGVNFLVESQNKNGSWGSARRTKGLNIYAPVPSAHDGFRLGSSALALSALIESGLSAEREDVAGAILKGGQHLIEELPQLKRGSGDALYNVWAHAYGMRALGQLYRLEPFADDQESIIAAIQQQIGRLERFESVSGGWGYYDFQAQAARPSSSPNSFTTATCLVALKSVEDLPGITIPERLIKRAVASIQRQRKSDFTYLYGEYLRRVPMYGINRPAGSLARSQACNVALYRYGDESVTVEVIDQWLERFFKRHGWLDIGRKRPRPHEAWFAVAGYFYYYGVYYASHAIQELPAEDQLKHKNRLAYLLLKRQETNGSWWDFPLYSYHEAYGTGYAVMALSRCR